MTLREIRAAKGLTQKEAAGFVGMPLRTYQRYERDEAYRSSIKYRYVCQRLEKHGYIDEEHGILTLEQIEKTCVQVCVEYSVQYCYLYGSYATGRASARSDVDLVVSFDDHGFRFSNLAETLHEGLRKRVDVMYPDQLKDNVDVIKDVLQNGILLYRRAGAGGAV